MDARQSPATADADYSLYNRPVREIAGTECGRPDVICPLCGRQGVDARYSIGGLASCVVVCRGCDAGFLNPPLSLEEIAAQYPPTYYGSTGRKFTRLVELGVRVVGRRHVRFLARQLEPGGRVLDVGCGRGILLQELCRQGFEAHGFEVSRAAAEGADPRIQLRIADDLMLANYPAEYFDQVIIWHVLEHVGDPREYLAEIHRILKPGGEVIIAVPNFSSTQARWTGPAWFHLDLPRHLFHFSMKSLKQLIDATGFDVISEHHFSLRQNPFGWVQSVLNMTDRLPRNGLYELLHAGRQNRPLSFSTVTKAIFWLAFLVGMPVGLAIEIVAAFFRRGATVHVVAKKRAPVRT